MSERLCWHYTVGARMAAILQSGELQPATAGVPEGERPAVWFSTNPVWEETANKLITTGSGKVIRSNKTTTEVVGGGLYRFGVRLETAKHGWKDFRALSGINRDHARQLAKVARKIGSDPEQWRVSFDPVPRSAWVTIEHWNGMSWELALRP